MKEKLFREEAENIKVPKDDVLKAIHLGMEKGDRIKGKHPRFRKHMYFITAAAITLLSTTLLVPSISHVLAEAPIVGGIYEKFNDVVGRNLESQKLITQLNEKATNRGIDVSITRSYFDGAVVGVTFDVEGKSKKDQNGNLIAFYEIFNGDERVSETKEITYLTETKSGWTGHIQISYPYSELPSDSTLPLTFMSFGEKEGSWKFDVPIKQLPYEKVALNKNSVSSIQDIKVQFDTLIKGNSSAAIDYSFRLPGDKDYLSLEILDDKQELVYETSNEILEDQKGRLTFLKDISAESKYIIVKPEIRFHEEDQFISLNHSTPIEINSERQELSVLMEQMIVEGNQFLIDFQVNSGNREGREFMLFQDFARTDVTLVKDSRKDIYEESIEHKIKVLDKKSLRFRSTFNLKNLNDFNPDDYVVRVRLGSLTSNLPLELDPVRIDLN